MTTPRASLTVEELTNRWPTIEQLAATSLRPSETIVPDAEASAPTRPGEGTLQHLRTKTKADFRPLDHVLGEGGMGIVREAEQTALGRNVAVKSLKHEHRSKQTELKLLEEAWITGALEHPNVVPVYDVGLDENRSPFVVLKRIEGRAWADLLHNPTEIHDRYKTRDPFEWNTRILIQLCNAVAFAHSRGIVHRDLKPDNVMIGSFGEVYLVDWGIAVSLKDEHAGRFSLARDAHEIAGTPCYMAPEMLGGKVPQISERTDVYLLGAILYEITTGSPPHPGPTMDEVLQSVISSPPTLPDGTSTDLAAIITRAMAFEPDARFENAIQLKLALEAFLQHRLSRQLCERADAKLARLLEHATHNTASHHRVELYEFFQAARFGYRHALDMWEDNEGARRGLHRAATMMVRYELERDDFNAAAVLLPDIENPPPELLREFDEASKRRNNELRRIASLEALERAYDPRTGIRSRSVIALALGGAWTITPLIAYLADLRAPSFWQLLATPAIFLTLTLALVTWARESMLATLTNRRFVGVLLIALVVQVPTYLAIPLFGLAPMTAQAILFLLWGAIAGLAALTLDWRMAIPAMGYLASYFATAFLPAAQWLIVSAAQFVLTCTCVVMWRAPVGATIPHPSAPA